MAKEKKPLPKQHEKPVKIDGEFFEVFKVVKKNKEDKAKKKPKDS